MGRGGEGRGGELNFILPVTSLEQDETEFRIYEAQCIQFFQLNLHHPAYAIIMHMHMHINAIQGAEDGQQRPLGIFFPSNVR